METLSTFHAQVEYISVLKNTLKNAIQTNRAKVPRNLRFQLGMWILIFTPIRRPTPQGIEIQLTVFPQYTTHQTDKTTVV